MRVDNGGIGLNVEIDGPPGASPVLFLHGISSSAATYGYLVPDLASTYRLHRLDFRGHGRSDRAPGGYLLPGYASDAGAVLDQLFGDEPAVVVGHSLGGLTAAYLTQCRPDRVRALFLEDPPLYVADPSTLEATPFADAFRQRQAAVRRWQAEGLDAVAISALVADAPSMTGVGTVGEESTPDALAANGYALSLLDPAVFDPVFDGTSTRDYDSDRSITVPGVLLQSDPTMGAAFFGDHAERLAKTSPSIEVVRLDGAGHRIHDSRHHRALYGEHLRRFLAEHASPPTTLR
jgi:pimeloyl-ACP methyl ester carboxylesterase